MSLKSFIALIRKRGGVSGPNSYRLLWVQQIHSMHNGWSSNLILLLLAFLLIFILYNFTQCSWKFHIKINCVSLLFTLTLRMSSVRNVTCSGFHGSSGLDDVLRPPRFCNNEPILCLRLLPCPCPSCILREEERDPERPCTFLPPCFVADSHVRARENA